MRKKLYTRTLPIKGPLLTRLMKNTNNPEWGPTIAIEFQTITAMLDLQKNIIKKNRVHFFFHHYSELSHAKRDWFQTPHIVIYNYTQNDNCWERRRVKIKEGLLWPCFSCTVLSD